MKDHNYFIYITTNPAKTTLYIGVTNNLFTRMLQHYENRGTVNTFAGKYHCYNLVYWERFQYVDHAIEREKELKKWSRIKKEKLINSLNPEWNFLNDEI
ncbi:MAG TPA: GIY-YIG nuclease family protein [Sphingobacteriaceae bacterium]|nr:GIY-YIG nuclease family protein [Sphingobacteriaceae bacterium]